MHHQPDEDSQPCRHMKGIVCVFGVGYTIDTIYYRYVLYMTPLQETGTIPLMLDNRYTET